MKRRGFVAGLGSTAVWAGPAHAQQPGHVRRIGWLENGRADDPAVLARTAVVREELEKLGWVVGRNLAIDYRWTVTSFEMAQQFGTELLKLEPDVLFCAGSPG